MIDHRRATELAATAIDIDLGAADRQRLDEHLTACAACRTELLALRGDAAALAALPAIEAPTWVRRAIGRRHGPRRAVLLVAAALVLAATVGVALAVGAGLRDRVVQNVRPSVAPVSSLAPASPGPSATAVPSASLRASIPPGPLPVAKAASFPAGSGFARIGAGPNGGVWVLTDHSGGVGVGGVDAPSVTLLALVDRTGRARPGWPVSLTGWRCAEDAPPHALSVASDGSIRLVCAQDTTSDAPARHVALAFDVAGRALPGWPVELPPGELDLTTVVIGDELRVLAREIGSTEGSTSTAQPAAWWLIGVSAAGEVRVGRRYEVADAAGSFDVRIASDGLAYRLGFTGDPGSVQTAITAFDLDGVRPGWPVTIDGITSQPVNGPDGLLVVVRLTKGQAVTAQTMAIQPTGGEAIVTSGDLPLDPLDDRTGAGSVLLAPIAAADGTAYVVGTADSTKAAVVHVSPGSGIGPLILLQKPLQPQGSCSPQDTGCGVWRSLPVVGPDGTLYVPESAVGEGGGLVSSSGGSLVAIAPDRSTPKGWPVFLPDTMAGFWSVLPRADGTIDTMAVVPSDAGNRWTLVTLAAGGTFQASTPIVIP